MAESKAMRESDIDRQLAATGLSLQGAQHRLARLLGLPPEVLGDEEHADTIVGGAWPCTLQESMRATCARCSAFVALSPRSQRILARRDVRVICLRCARRELRTEANA